MKKDYSFEHEQMRKELWIKAWCGATKANGYKDTVDARDCADIALKDFDSRFQAPVESKSFYEKTGFKTPPNFTEDKIG